MEMVATQPYPFMETVAGIKADGANILQKPNSYLLPFMETVQFKVELSKVKLEAVRTENQRLHIELGNSESEKEFLGNKCRNCDRNFETERTDRESIEAKQSSLKKSCSGRHTFQKINTRRGDNSQPARPPGAKNQKLTWQSWNSFWKFYKAEATKLYSHPLTKWLQYCNCK
jgi:hypothetical protein